MELKKSKEASLENKKTGFFFLGLVMAAAIVGMAFQLEQFTAEEKVAKQDKKKLNEEIVYDIQQEEEIPEEEPEVAPPPPEPLEIKEVEDDIIVPEVDFSDVGKDIVAVPVEEEKGPVAQPILEIAEIDPIFPGGEAAMAEFIQKNIVYPPLSVEMGEQGAVFVQFVVNTDGSIVDVKVVKSISDALDAEAKRVIKKMPKWKPGEQAGKPARVRYTLPIQFRLG
jgi:protein TonB